MRPLWFTLLVACGSASVPPTGNDASTIADATAEWDPSLEDGFAPLPEAGEAPDVGLLDGGGLFLCFGCICDGRTSYCNTSEKFPALDPIFGDAGACGSTSRCKPYPPGCAPNPTCACIKACSCERADGGDGLYAGCFYP